jgi:hypothetical protein
MWNRHRKERQQRFQTSWGACGAIKSVRNWRALNELQVRDTFAGPAAALARRVPFVELRNAVAGGWT